MAARTARKLIATAKKTPELTPKIFTDRCHMTAYDINSLADDVYAYKLELEKSNP